MSEDQHDAMTVDSGSGVEEHDEQQQELKVILEVTGVTLEEEGTVVGSNGVLIITSRCVRWSLGPTASDLSREWDYQHILLHAVSKDAEKPNIYCQIAVGAPPGPDDDESQVQEVKFIPSNADMLQHMWDALSEGAALNPDPHQEEREPDAGEFFFNPDEVYAEGSNNIDGNHDNDNEDD